MHSMNAVVYVVTPTEQRAIEEAMKPTGYALTEVTAVTLDTSGEGPLRAIKPITPRDES